MINLILAILGGIIPALVWLSFWLQEDSKQPEPRNLIIKTFLLGMLGVPFAILFQLLMCKLFLNGEDIGTVFRSTYWIGLASLIFFAFIEEILKLLGAYFGGLRNRENNEAVDSVMYLITSALGFSALENTLFILQPLLVGNSATAFITGNMRFVGATLLHVASSAVIGMFIAYSYRKVKEIKRSNLIWGIFFATVLHTIFNSFIIRAEKFTLIGFSLVWLSVIALILMFEKVKKII